MRLFIIGGGKMGQAITKGLLRKNILPPHDICIIDPHIDGSHLPKNVEYQSTLQAQIVQPKDIVILAVKPQIMPEVLSSLPQDTALALIITIAAGISIDNIANHLGGARIVRVMPNTAAEVGLSMSVYCMNSACGTEEKKLVEKLFSAIGEVYEVKDEDLMHGVTALSGSGPAYVFHFMEALMEAGRKLGLSEELVRLSVVQLLRGSLALAGDGDNLTELRENVTSKGGTTEAALEELMKHLSGLMERTLKEAEKRSRELDT